MTNKIYIVDDDPAILESLCWLIEGDGLPVVPFKNAQELLEAPLRDAGCIVLDIRMPGMTGMELQEQLAATGHTPPIVFITGHGEVDMAVRAMKRGAFDFLQKPFDEQALLESIHKALNLNKRKLTLQAERQQIEE